MRSVFINLQTLLLGNKLGPFICDDTGYSYTAAFDDATIMAHQLGGSDRMMAWNRQDSLPYTKTLPIPKTPNEDNHGEYDWRIEYLVNPTASPTNQQAYVEQGFNVVTCVERHANNGTRHITIYYRRKKGTFDLQLDDNGQVIVDATTNGSTVAR